MGFTATTPCLRYLYINVQACYLENTCANTIIGIGHVSLQILFHIYFFSVTFRPNYGSWPSLTELHDHLIGHTKPYRTPLDE